MSKLKILVVEGNTKEENVNFNQAGCVSQSENFSEHIKMHEPGCEVDIIEPADNSSMERIISSLKKYNGIILTGSTLRINDNSEDVKRHIDFTRRCFEHTDYIYAACWGLQVSVAAAGGKCRVSPNGAITGIAQDVVLTDAGIKHGLYKSKPKKFNAPGFNFDEVEVPPKNSVLLASTNINKFAALHFTAGKSEVWVLQYHPEIPYSYMIRLLKHRKKRLIDNKNFENENELNKHIDLITKENLITNDNSRTLELKNWLDHIKESKFGVSIGKL